MKKKKLLFSSTITDYPTLFIKTIAVTTTLSLLCSALPALSLSVHAAAVTTTSSEASKVPAITAFDPLTEDVSVLSYKDKPDLNTITASFPQALSVYLDEATAATSIAVTWSCTTDYNNIAADAYTFTPSWDNTLYTLSPTLSSPQNIPSIVAEVNCVPSQIVLTNAEKAAESLPSITDKKEVLALVYLCSSYDIKSSARKSSPTAVTVNSGQSVRIIGVSQDKQQNIWYKVTLQVKGSNYEGYVERKNLAYSDEDFIKWEQQNINIYRARSGVLPATQADIDAEINQFPESYRAGLKVLKTQHPNWTFVPMVTGLDFMASVKAENTGELSLIENTVNSAWIGRPGKEPRWPHPNDKILAHFMDPRNFLDETRIFQFELLTFNATYHTQTATQSMLNDSFMSGLIKDDTSNRTYSESFWAIASTYNVSPFHLASRVLQEQGKAGTSPLISGTYPGYENCYNYFNVGASGSSNTEVIIKGLNKAKESQWFTRYASLAGGASLIAEKYVSSGQNTIYLQKFNVQPGISNPYTHQYMQNIMAPYTESAHVKNAYTNAGSINNRFVFSIPVYENMQSTPYAQPTAAETVSLDKPSLSLSIDGSDTLSVSVGGTLVNSSTVSFSSEDAKIATVDASGKVTAASPGSTIIVCSVAGSYAYCTVTVSKANPSYTIPSLGEVIYSPDKKLKDITLPTGWTWNNPDIVPTVTNSGYPATFTPTDSGIYNTVSIIISLTVKKGIPSYIIPSGLQTAAGNTLASLKLPLFFTWDNPSYVLSSEGTANYKASYNPDPANFDTVTGIDIPVTVTAKTTACTNHAFGEWENSKAPDCTTDGSNYRSCHLCGYHETAAIPALGHSYTSTVTKEPAATEEGVRTYTCTRCNHTYTEAIPKLPSNHMHSYTSQITKEATCTEKGTKKNTCACGDSYNEDISATGHDYTNAITKEPTEKEDGVRTFTCSKCKNSYTEAIAKLPSSHKHSYTSQVIKAPTCTEKGTQTYTCTCKDSYSEEISALGHDLSNGKCTRCGYLEQQSTTTTTTPSPNPPKAENLAGSNKPAVDSDKASSDSDKATGNFVSKTPVSAKGPAANKAGAPDAAVGTDSDKAKVTIDMESNTVLYKESLSSIKGQDINVVLNMGNNINWAIRGNNITDDSIDGIDMGVAIDSGKVPKELIEKAKAAAPSKPVMELSFAYDGELPFRPTLTFSASMDNAGQIANLYYYNPETNRLEYADAVEVNENGEVAFTFAHASDYVVIINEYVMSDTAYIGDGENADSDITVVDGVVDEGTDLTGKPQNNSTLIIVIILILVIAIIMGLTLFFILKKKETDEDDSFDDEEEDSLDSEDFVDDYREPEIAKKTGKVISLQNSNKTDDDFDHDEFDGFE